MTKNKLKYYQELVQFWLIKTAIVFSVFSFSGFHSQVHTSFNQSVKTELVEFRNVKSDYKLKKPGKTLLPNPSSQVNQFSKWTLVTYNRIIKTKLKLYQGRVFLYPIRFIALLVKKIPYSSNKSEAPPLFVG